nr:stalk domain-containing protein [Sedimentibacter sp.]
MKIKKAAVIGMCCTIISTSTVFAVSENLNANDNIKIQINNEWLDVDVSPFIENDRTIVSLNEFMVKLGAKVESDLETGKIKISSEDVTIELTVGKKNANIIKNDGSSSKEEAINLEVAPKIVGEDVFVPLRFAAEALGFDVEWDNSLRAVIVRGEDEIITVERPVEFEIIDEDTINNNDLLLNMYNKNRMTKGIYSLTDGDYIYVLVSAGERPTGGYSIEVDSITEVTPGTAYIHATLDSPKEGSMVTQVLTYPTAMVKFDKGDIDNLQWDLSGDIQSEETEKNEVVKFVQGFGEQLKMVSLLAPEDVIKESMEEHYGDYVSTELIEKWVKDPENALGRMLSSPWPERIEVLSAEKTDENGYVVKGKIIEVTSVELKEGGAAARRPVTLNVDKIDGKWVITDTEIGNYEEIQKNSVVYKNDEYGFTFTLPESWKDYSIQNEVWKGEPLNDESNADADKDITGPIIYIRHPQWTKDNPRQDIPIMIFTTKQWEDMENGEFAVGAAPVAPSKLGENSEYVFLLPARYNYAFPTGFEEVSEILQNNPMQAFEIK